MLYHHRSADVSRALFLDLSFLLIAALLFAVARSAEIQTCPGDLTLPSTARFALDVPPGPVLTVRVSRPESDLRPPYAARTEDRFAKVDSEGRDLPDRQPLSEYSYEALAEHVARLAAKAEPCYVIVEVSSDSYNESVVRIRQLLIAHRLTGRACEILLERM